MGFHPANFLGLSALELGRGTRQTEALTDRRRPSFYNALSSVAVLGFAVWGPVGWP